MDDVRRVKEYAHLTIEFTGRSDEPVKIFRGNGRLRNIAIVGGVIPELESNFVLTTIGYRWHPSACQEDAFPVNFFNLDGLYDPRLILPIIGKETQAITDQRVANWKYRDGFLIRGERTIVRPDSKGIVSWNKSVLIERGVNFSLVQRDNSLSWWFFLGATKLHEMVVGFSRKAARLLNNKKLWHDLRDFFLRDHNTVFLSAAGLKVLIGINAGGWIKDEFFIFLRKYFLQALGESYIDSAFEFWLKIKRWPKFDRVLVRQMAEARRLLGIRYRLVKLRGDILTFEVFPTLKEKILDDELPF